MYSALSALSAFREISVIVEIVIDSLVANAHQKVPVTGSLTLLWVVTLK
jgi:hypothetical protein